MVPEVVWSSYEDSKDRIMVQRIVETYTHGFTELSIANQQVRRAFHAVAFNSIHIVLFKIVINHAMDNKNWANFPHPQVAVRQQPTLVERDVEQPAKNSRGIQHNAVAVKFQKTSIPDFFSPSGAHFPEAALPKLSTKSATPGTLPNKRKAATTASENISKFYDEDGDSDFEPSKQKRNIGI